MQGPLISSFGQLNLTTAERHQKRGRVDHRTGGHENDVCVYKKVNYELHHMAMCGCALGTNYFYFRQNLGTKTLVPSVNPMHAHAGRTAIHLAQGA